MTTTHSTQKGAAVPSSLSPGLRAKDGFATVMVGFTVLAVVAVVRGGGWPLLSSPRSGAIVVGVIGMVVCSAGSAYVPGQRGFFIFAASALGVTALGLLIATLVTNSQTLLIVLGADVVALWVISTVRHALKSSSVPS